MDGHVDAHAHRDMHTIRMYPCVYQQWWGGDAFLWAVTWQERHWRRKWHEASKKKHSTVYCICNYSCDRKHENWLVVRILGRLIIIKIYNIGFRCNMSKRVAHKCQWQLTWNCSTCERLTKRETKLLCQTVPLHGHVGIIWPLNDMIVYRKGEVPS